MAVATHSLNPLSPLRDRRGDAGATRRRASLGSQLRRVAKMSLAEVAVRSRQAASKWAERMRPRVAADPLALLAREARALAEPGAALRFIRDTMPDRFFAGADAAAAVEVRRHFPGDAARLLDSANQIRSGSIDLLGYRLSFGDRIDWHADPVWSRRAPQVHWSRIDPLDPDQVGDSKVVWELNRHQWLVRLAQAYALTGDERYARTCSRAIDDWLDANPHGIGLNWASSLEVALRLIAWSWTVMLIRQSSVISTEWMARVLAAVYVHATHVRKYLSHYYSPNTHLLGEALGLFYAGTLFAEFDDAAKWRRDGSEILIDQFGAQTTGDGVYFEQSTCYQRYTVEMYQHFLLLAARNQIAVPDHIRTRLAMMVDFLVAVRLPNGSIPNIGDADGGDLLSLIPREPEDARGVFATAALLHDRPDFAGAAGGPVPDLLWLMGPDALRDFRRVGKSVPASAPSQLFASGGYAVLRDGWQGEGHQMIVDVGPLGCSHSAGHGHADLLSIQCAAFGQPCIVDAGTGTYTPEPQWRRFFRGTSAHSTIAIDGRGQSDSTGPFSWTRRPRATVLEWWSTDGFDLVDAEHRAYADSGRPVIHRRRVVFIKPHCWVLIDDLTGDGQHWIDSSFQFAPMPVGMVTPDWVRADTDSGASLWVSSFPQSPLLPAITRGATAPIRGWISSRYGQRQPAPALTYSGMVTLPWRSLTVLFPVKHAGADAPAVDVLRSAAAVPLGLRFSSLSMTLRIDDSTVRLERD
jgi:hypothetical protein